VPLAATDINICSNYLPEQWWSEKTKFDVGAIYRRISVVHWHYEFKKIRIFKSETPGQVKDCALDKFYVEYRKEFPLINVL